MTKLLSAADGADGMFVTPADRLDAALFTRVASSVKVIATHSAGYDHIDFSAAAARKIAIANIPGVSTDAVADVTLLLLLGASGYLSLKNTFLLPHIGAATIETRTAMGVLALDNIKAVLNGMPAPSLLTSESVGLRNSA